MSTHWLRRQSQRPGYTAGVITDAPYPNRLAQCMKVAGVTDPSLASLAGTTKQQIFKLRRGERKLTVQWAQRLAPHLGVRWHELVEAPHPLNGDHARTALLAAFDAMNDSQKQALLTMAEGVVHHEPAETDAPSERPRRRAVACDVPVVPMRRQGG